MKRLINTFSQIGLGCLLFASCKTASSIQKRTIDFDYINVSKKGIIQRPLVADLTVSDTKMTLTKTYENVNVEQAKQLVSGDFSLENNCDVAVQPFFETNTVITEVKKTVTVTMIAYPAYFKNIKHYDPLDSNTNKLLFHNFSNVGTISVVAPSNTIAATSNNSSESKEEKTSKKASKSTEETPTVKEPKRSKKNESGSQTRIKTARTDGFKFGVNAFYTIPTGDLANYFKSGFGEGLNFIIPINHKVGINVGADHFGLAGKDNGIYTLQDVSVISYHLGIRYKVIPKVFVEPKYDKSYCVSSPSGNSAGYSLGAGYAFSRSKEITLAYNHVNENAFGFVANYLTLKAGFYF